MEYCGCFTRTNGFSRREGANILMYIPGIHRYPKKKIDDIISPFCFGRLFYNFRFILAATVYSRQNNLDLKPFPIFLLKNAWFQI